MEFSHISVLLNETIEALQINPSGIYLDGTAGGGGHSFEIAKRLTEGGRLICLDQDEEAVEAASKRLEAFRDRVVIIRENFVNFRRVLNDLEIDRADGILLDLGVSSHQFDDPSRGFSYREDAPLDMRMDRGSGMTAAELLNTADESTLTGIIRDYGEEKWAARIASMIC